MSFPHIGKFVNKVGYFRRADGGGKIDEGQSGRKDEKPAIILSGKASAAIRGGREADDAAAGLRWRSLSRE